MVCKIIRKIEEKKILPWRERLDIFELFSAPILAEPPSLLNPPVQQQCRKSENKNRNRKK